MKGTNIDSKTIRELYMSLSRVLEDSTTYQWIVKQGFAKGEAQGRSEEARRLLLRQAKKRFGEPSEQQAAALNAVADLDQLEQLADRVLDAASWDDLLANP